MMIQAKKDYEVETDLNKRKDLKNKIARYDNLQLAKKVSLNSAYGALGSQYFRFYDLRMALAVTLAGQLSIRWIEKKLNGYLNKLLKSEEDYVIASDTDSIYLRLGPLVDNVYGTGQKDSVPSNIDKQQVIAFMDRVCEDKIQPFIDSSYQELATYVHAYSQKMQMKREALANKGIWTAKKRYILNIYNNEGVQYKEPQMKVMGLEMIKSSTPAAIREKMRLSIKIMINGTEDDIHTFIEEFRKEFKKSRTDPSVRLNVSRSPCDPAGSGSVRMPVPVCMSSVEDEKQLCLLTGISFPVIFLAIFRQETKSAPAFFGWMLLSRPD
jgi:DNA polymerase elongation subunit (family B)